MADFFNKKQKNGMGSFADFKSKTAEEESTADILYPTMANLRRVLCREEKVQCTFSSRGKNGVSELDNVRASATTGQRPAGATGSRESKFKTNIKSQTSSFSDAFSGNSSSEKKKSGTLLGESIYDDDDDFKDLKFDFKADSDKPKDDWKTKQIKDEDERISKLKRTADILYGKTTPEHGIYWKGDTDNSSSVEKDNNIDETKTNTSSKISDDDDDEDILDLFYPTMKNLKSKDKTSSLRDESKSQTSSAPAKVSDNDEEDDILDLMYPSMRGIQSKFKTDGIKSKNDSEQASIIKDEIGKATSSNLPKFAPDKKARNKSTEKSEKTEFDSGMKIPEIDKTFDEDFDTDETEDKPGNEIEEQENDFPSEISNKKKKSDKDGIVSGGAAEISKNQNEYLPTKSGKILNDNGIDLVFGNDVDINKKTGVKADFELAKKGAKAVFQVFKEDMKITDEDWKEINKSSSLENKLASDIVKTRLLLSKLGEKFSNSDVKNLRIDEIMKRIGKDKSKEMIEDYLAGSFISERGLSRLIGSEAANLLKLSQENADFNKEFTKDADKFQSAYDLPEKYQNTVAAKLKSQDMPVNSKGVVFHSNSESAKNALEQTELQDLLVKNLNDIVIKSAKNEPCEFTVTFEKNMNFRLAFHKADVKNLKITPLGTITGDIIDVTDFNGNENDILIRAGRELQEEGKLKPIFVVIHFSVKLEDIYALKLQRENK